MAVEADHLLDQIMPETIHHRHNNDERRHSENDTEKRKPRDDRNPLPRIARAQIPEGNHSFEWPERSGRLGPHFAA
jgi:hypothetical protein